MANIIIDFEFTGLYNYCNRPEVVQVLAMNVDTNESVRANFRSKNPMTAGALVCCGGYNPTENATEYFSADKFYKLLREEISATPSDHYFGFGIRTDRTVLFKEYGVEFANYTDLSELCMLTEGLELRMALEGRSMECVYYMITGKVRTPQHGTFEELDMIKRIYDHVVYADGIIKPTHGMLNYMPHGEMAGMPIYDYCLQYRRRADGYRFNNSDLLARTMTLACEVIDTAPMSDLDDDE